MQARYYTDGTCRLYKPYTDRRISSKFNFVDSCSRTDDTLTSYQSLEGKWSFLNTMPGKVGIPAIYENVWDFNEGLAAVADESNRVGFIGKTGALVTPMLDVDHTSGYYPFENGIAILEAPVTGLKGGLSTKRVSGSSRWSL